MTRKSRTPGTQSPPFSCDEIFHYHLTELELNFEAGTIGWTAEAVAAARGRLDKLAAALDRLKAMLREG